AGDRPAGRGVGERRLLGPLGPRTPAVGGLGRPLPALRRGRSSRLRRQRAGAEQLRGQVLVGGVVLALGGGTDRGGTVGDGGGLTGVRLAILANRLLEQPSAGGALVALPRRRDDDLGLLRRRDRSGEGARPERLGLPLTG